MAEGRWGPINGIDSNDYQFMMQGSTVVSKPVSLVGHTLTSPNQELTDALQYTDVRLNGGVIRPIRRTKRAAHEIGRTYTVGYPSTLMTELKLRAIRGQETTIFMKYLCPDDDQYNHVHILPEATLNPPIEASDPITGADDISILTETSEAQVSEKLTCWQIGHTLTATLAGAAETALKDIAYQSEPCSDTGVTADNKFIAVGGDDDHVSDQGYVGTTEDRFATVTDDVASGAAPGVVFQGVVTDGDLVIMSEVGAADYSDTSGVVNVSVDAGATFAQSNGATEPIYSIAQMGQLFLGVGKSSGATATGPSGAWLSSNRGSSWEEVSSSVLGNSTTILKDIAYDEDKARAYIVGTNSTGPVGVLLLATESGGAITIADLSANLAGSPTGLTRVSVLGEDHILVGGAAGYMAESFDGGVTFTQVSVSTTSEITGIDGTAYRVVFGAANKLYERSPISDFDFNEITLENGATLTGNVTRVRMNKVDEDINSFVAVTDVGEVVVAVPFYPGA